MERPEFSDQNKRPELDPHNPRAVFDFAREKQYYLRRRIPRAMLPGAIDNLAASLNEVQLHAGEPHPEVVIHSSDVMQTTVSRGVLGEYRLVVAPMPPDGGEELHEGHSLRGNLYGFHRGQDNDIRIFVATVDAPPLEYPAGIIVPLLSVGIETSEVKYADDINNELVQRPLAYIKEHLDPGDEVTAQDVAYLLHLLDSPGQDKKTRLQNSAVVFSKILKQSHLSIPLRDALLEAVSLKLDIAAPHDIEARQHGIVFTDSLVSGYKPLGPENFFGVTPQLDVMGETLWLYFIDHDGTAICVCARDIKHIKKTKPKLL